jgi:NADPH:quinone reductase-like Zn-dependent oxidoreductase
MRAVQITRFGGPEVLDIVDLPDPVPGDGQKLYEVSSAGVKFADTHHRPTNQYPAPTIAMPKPPRRRAAWPEAAQWEARVQRSACLLGQTRVRLLSDCDLFGAGAEAVPLAR